MTIDTTKNYTVESIGKNWERTFLLSIPKGLKSKVALRRLANKESNFYGLPVVVKDEDGDVVVESTTKFS